MREASVAQQTALEAARNGILTMRNNVGACQDETGRWIRYGLMNESKKQNELIKSSDQIGITPVTAYVEGWGWLMLGVFTAFETKHPGWTFHQSDKRAVAQAAFHDIVRNHGGFAGFVTDPAQDVKRICRR